jgi:putative sigma-54 modulation protein
MMQIQYTSHNTDVTNDLKEFASSKLDRLNTYHDNITSVHITFSENSLSKTVEANIQIPGNILHAKSEGQDHESAVNVLIDKLVRQLKKHKEKTDAHR